MNNQKDIKTGKNTLYAPKFTNDWEESFLYPLADWLNGMAFKDSSFSKSGKPIIKIAEIKNGIGGQTKFTNEQYDEKYLLKKGDMLFCWSGQPETSIDIFWWDGPVGWLNQHIFKVIPRIENEKFFYYLLKYLKPNFIQIGINKQTTGLGHVTKGDLEKIIVKLPANNEQNKIAAMLSSLDDKIALLRTQNETLEKIAQGIFKEWFVNFTIDGKKLKLKDGIPEGWRIGKLGEIINLQGGFVHDTGISGRSISKIAKMGVVDGKSWFNRNSVMDYSGNIDEKYKLKEDDIIICTRDMTQDRIIIGNVAIVPRDLANAGLYAGSNTWVINSDLNRYFLFMLFREDVFRQHIIQSSKGTTIIMITRDSFLNCDVTIPPNEAIDSIMEEIAPIFEKIKNGNSQIQTLSRLRDILLPKLMSGEVIMK